MVPLVAGIGGVWLYESLRAPDFVFLSTHRSLLDEICETIIPGTAAPGARAAGVGGFVYHVISSQMSATNASRLIDGIDKINLRCRQKFSLPFVACGMPERIAVLEYFENEGGPGRFQKWNKVKKRIFGEGFMPLLKRLVVTGYCQSEAGATSFLAYQHIPVTFNGCTSLTPGQPCWATK